MAKKISSIRYSPEAKRLLKRLAAKLAVSESAVIELAIRRMAKEEGLRGA
jgi:predicted transcriptional regulator